jgi:hypothetical protein
MEILMNNNVEVKPSGFIEANTTPIHLDEIKGEHIIPVFLKDNEPTISHVDFIKVVSEAAADVFDIPFTPDADIRVSHPVKGRVYNARYKKAAELLDHEKTIYYERMAFIISLPISDNISGNTLELTVGGVKAYNLDNLNNNNGSQSFKVFIGYKNTVCTNLCVSTDGLLADLKVSNEQRLYEEVSQLFKSFKCDRYLEELKVLPEYQLSEHQFATLIGKARLYQYLPKAVKMQIPELLINDTQISRVAESYFKDCNFQVSSDGAIDLWRFYNLLTGAVKSSYIDRLLDREVNAYQFTKQVQSALKNDSDALWYLN